MGKKRMPKSLRKFIRREKARIRREVLDMKEQEDKIKELYQKFSKTKNKNKGQGTIKKEQKNKKQKIQMAKLLKISDKVGTKNNKQ